MPMLKFSDQLDSNRAARSERCFRLKNGEWSNVISREAFGSFLISGLMIVMMPV